VHDYVGFSQIFYSSLLGSTFSIFLPSPYRDLSTLVWWEPLEAALTPYFVLHHFSSTVVFQFGSVRLEELAVITGRPCVRMDDINTVRGAAWYSERIVHDLFVRIQELKTRTY
jgi:hypothetical protein